MTDLLDKTAILPVLEAERLSLADFLDDLTAAEWQQRSLCSAWTTHEVLAHLTVCTRTSGAELVRRAVRARGNFDRMEADQAVERAARYTPAELIAQFRETAGSARRTPLSAPLDPLVDVLVHAQDIARPLGRVREMPPELLPACLDHVWNSVFYGTKKRFRGRRLIATDVGWSAGDGPDVVHASGADLLLIATGRSL